MEAQRGTKDTKLLAAEIEETARKLQLRIHDRFPDSGLASVCGQIHVISKEAIATCEWIAHPNHILRYGILAAIIVLALALVFSIALISLESTGLTIADFVTMIDAAVSEILLIGAGVFFLVTLDARRKRRRIIKSVNRLRSLAHIIDAHQLTKDPDGTAKISAPTKHSPSREINEYDLGRYLDYCSEMLSLIGKLGFLYVQDFDDPASNVAANELENLTTDLSRKIWQKIMILRMRTK